MREIDANHRPGPAISANVNNPAGDQFPHNALQQVSNTSLSLVTPALPPLQQPENLFLSLPGQPRRELNLCSNANAVASAPPHVIRPLQDQNGDTVGIISGNKFVPDDGRPAQTIALEVFFQRQSAVAEQTRENADHRSVNAASEIMHTIRADQPVVSDIITLPLRLSEQDKALVNRCVEQYARSTSADSSYAVHYYAVGSRDKDVTQIVIKVFDKAFRPVVLAKGDTLKYRWNLTLRLLKWLKEAEEQGKNVHGQAMENVRYLNPDAIELNAASGEIKLGLTWHLLNFLGANNHEIDKYLQQTFTRYNYLAPEVSAEVISDAPAHRSEKAAIFSTCMLINKIIKFSYIINSIGTSEARQADIANAKAMNFGKNARATAAELFTAFNQLDPDMRQQIELEENGMDSELLKIFRETLLKDN